MTRVHRADDHRREVDNRDHRDGDETDADAFDSGDGEAIMDAVRKFLERDNDAEDDE
jgi:hypothetical protein